VKKKEAREDTAGQIIEFSGRSDSLTSARVD
jgi:hypothetical protein